MLCLKGILVTFRDRIGAYCHSMNTLLGKHVITENQSATDPSSLHVNVIGGELSPLLYRKQLYLTPVGVAVA